MAGLRLWPGSKFGVKLLAYQWIRKPRKPLFVQDDGRGSGSLEAKEAAARDVGEHVQLWANGHSEA